MVRPSLYIPLDDVMGLRTLVRVGMSAAEIAAYYTEHGLPCSKTTIVRRMKKMKE